MCGRYASFLPPEFIARLFATVNPLPNLMPTWNLAPTDDAPVVLRHLRSGERHLDVLKWGLVPYFAKDLKKARKPINARSETVATSGMFRAAFAKRRCLVPAAAYYEWRDDPEGKVPFAVARVDGDPVAFGGIWEEWRSPDGETLRTFATITTDANRQLRHRRAGELAALVGRGCRRSRHAASTGRGRCAARLAGRQKGRQRQERRAGAVGSARLRKPHCFSRLLTHPDFRVLNLLALQKLDYLAFGASHECDANFYQRILAEDRCAWRNA
jgi:putative SOS response-associated peptidase YedK